MQCSRLFQDKCMYSASAKTEETHSIVVLVVECTYTSLEASRGLGKTNACILPNIYSLLTPSFRETPLHCKEQF